MREEFSLRRSLIGLSIALPLLGPSSLLAADYEPPLMIDQAPEYVPVEVGSSWYLRGDIGGAVNKFEDSEHDGLEEKKLPLVASIGMGYHWTDYFRSELNIGILPANRFTKDGDTSCAGLQTTTTNIGFLSGTSTSSSSRPCNGHDEGSNRSYSLFADAYVDLGTYAGFTPYVGGGIGAVYTKTRADRGAQDCFDTSTTTAIPGGSKTVDFNCYGGNYYDGSDDADTQYNFAYDLSAGVSYRLSTNGSIDLGYQFISVPEAKTVGYDNGNFTYDKGMDVHSVKVGFRYDTW